MFWTIFVFGYYALMIYLGIGFLISIYFQFRYRHTEIFSFALLMLVWLPAVILEGDEFLLSYHIINRPLAREECEDGNSNVDDENFFRNP